MPCPATSNEETRPKPVMVQTGPVTGVDPRKMQPQENKSRSELQKELLGLKRALGLRREGKAEEADEVLRQARILENELDEVQAYEPAGRSKPPPKGFSEQSPHKPSLFAQNDDEVQVTDDDMLDPQLMTALQNVSWKDEAPRRYPDPDYLEGLVSAQSSKGLAPLKADHKAANNTGQADTSGRITSWTGQARQDGNVSGPGGPSKPVSGADVAQEGRSTWDEVHYIPSFSSPASTTIMCACPPGDAKPGLQTVTRYFWDVGNAHATRQPSLERVAHAVGLALQAMEQDQTFVRSQPEAAPGAENF